MNLVKQDITGKRVLVFDLESTTYIVSYAEILQFSGILYDDSIEKWEMVNFYFTPTGSIPAKITDLTGLDAKYLREQSDGLTFFDQAEELNKFLDTIDVFVGHNINKFDLPLLQSSLVKAGINFNTRNLETFDTMIDFKCLLPERGGRWPKLGDLFHSSFPDPVKADELAETLLVHLGANEHEMHAHNAKYDVIINSLALAAARRKYNK